MKSANCFTQCELPQNIMFGNLLSSIIKTVTLPIDAANSGMDMLCGGDGSKRSRTRDDTPLAMLENLRDKISEAAEDINSK